MESNVELNANGTYLSRNELRQYNNNNNSLKMYVSLKLLVISQSHSVLVFIVVNIQNMLSRFHEFVCAVLHTKLLTKHLLSPSSRELKISFTRPMCRRF